MELSGVAVAMSEHEDRGKKMTVGAAGERVLVVTSGGGGDGGGSGGDTAGIMQAGEENVGAYDR